MSGHDHETCDSGPSSCKDTAWFFDGDIQERNSVQQEEEWHGQETWNYGQSSYTHTAWSCDGDLQERNSLQQPEDEWLDHQQQSQGYQDDMVEEQGPSNYMWQDTVEPNNQTEHEAEDDTIYQQWSDELTQQWIQESWTHSPGHGKQYDDHGEAPLKQPKVDRSIPGMTKRGWQARAITLMAACELNDWERMKWLTKKQLCYKHKVCETCVQYSCTQVLHFNNPGTWSYPTWRQRCRSIVSC